MHVRAEIKRDPLKVPDWAIAYAIIHMDFKPFRAPEEQFWGLPRRIETLKALRGGWLPPGVPPTLPDHMMAKLQCAYEEFKSTVEEFNEH